MRTRRKRKFTWLPNIGLIQSVSDQQYWLSQYQDAIQVSLDFAPNLVVVGVFQDFEQEKDTFGEGLGEIIGNEYFLRRLVGKFHCCYTQHGGNPDQGNTAIPSAAIVTAGFFVARGKSPNETAPDGPIGSGDLVSNPESLPAFDMYSPLANHAIREPWIWRRTWILGNNLEVAPLSATGGANRFPPTNAGYGSVADGPHIDAKTARRISQEDRLWFAVSAIGFSMADDSATNTQFDGTVYFNLDVRGLGALRKARNRGVF